MTDGEHAQVARERLHQLNEIHGKDLPLLPGMAAIATEEDPDTSEAEILHAMSSLSKGLYIPPDASVYEQAARFTHHMNEELGFKGDSTDFHNPSNSLIHQALVRKKGLPITLSIIGIELGRQAGITLEGIGFPGHFLLKIKDGTPPFYIDPYNQGKIHRQEDLMEKLKEQFGQVEDKDFIRAIQPNSSRQILMRVNNNLIHAFQLKNDPKGMLRAIERNLILKPAHSEFHRVRGVLLKSLGRYHEAIEAIEFYLEQEPDGPDAEDMLQELSLMKGIG